MLYLIEPQALQTLRDNQHNAPSASELLAYLRDTPTSAGPSGIEGHVATISVEGVLTPKPDLFARLFLGANTTYGGIRAALSSAKSDPRVTHVVLNVSSPGGTVDGLFETLEAIKDFKASGKTMSVTTNFACSAAYAIAAVAGNIAAVGDWATLGSVGVAASYRVSKDIVDLASTDAPNKRPDVTTTAGRAVVTKELNDIHALFVRYIAEGRGLPTNANFGKGGTMLAREALSLKMIDSIGSPSGAGKGAGALGPMKQKALELKALMGDQEAIADLMIQKMQRTGVAQPRPSAKSSSSSEQRTNAVANIVCGTEARDVGDDIADLMFGKQEASSDEAANLVADIVCGVREATLPSFGQLSPRRASQSDADRVADIVCGDTERDEGDDIADRMLGPETGQGRGVVVTWQDGTKEAF